MNTTKTVFSNGKKKGFTQIQEGQPQQRKKRVGRRLNRFFSRISKENGLNSLRKTPSKQNSDSEELKSMSSYSSYTTTEVLRVSPMSTSCEVTLVFSDDGFETHQESTVFRGEDEEEQCKSYHIVLNPHRTTRKSDDDDDDDDGVHSGETGSKDVTHDMSDGSSSSDMNDNASYDKTMPLFTDGSGAAVDHATRENDDGHITGSGNDEHDRGRHDFMVHKYSIFYESLFVASDSEDDDNYDGDEDDDSEFLDGNNWHIHGDEQLYSNIPKPHVPLVEPDEILNITLDTALDDDHEDSLSSRDAVVPIEITVRKISLS